MQILIKLRDSFNLYILFATVEVLDKKLSRYKVSKSVFDDQLEDLCEPPFLMAE